MVARRAGRAPRTTNGERLARAAAERKKGERALTIVSSLAAAVKSLAQAATSVPAEERVYAAPPPTAFESPTACMRSYLPDTEIPDHALDFVCEETDAWALDWKVRGAIVNRLGSGARRWQRLGWYSMAALTTMRKGCCVDPPYLQAKVPGLWCGILRDTLRGFQAVPTTEKVREFDETMQCLSGRGMNLPAAFTDVNPEVARRAFDQFLETARLRGAPGNVPPRDR